MGCNPGCRVVVVEERQVTACSAGDRPGGLGGAVYLLVRSLIRVHSFVRQYKVVNAFNWGSGDAIKCYASMLDHTGA